MGLLRKLIDSIAGNPSEPAGAEFPPIPVTTTLQRRPEPFTNPGEADFASSPTSLIQQDLSSTEISQFLNTVPKDSDSILDEVVGALDATFDNACSQSSGNEAGHAELRADEEASIQELFAGITAAYAVPLKNFIYELHRHTATRDSIEFCRPVLRSVINAAEKVHLPETVHRMEELDQCLAVGQAAMNLFLEGEIRDQILSKYDSLAEVMPGSFRIGDESRKREDIIIQSLLQEIPGVGCVTLEKLYQSGLGSLHTLCLGNPEDLAAATAIRRPLCEKICHKMSQYRTESEDRASQPDQSGYRSRLVEIVNELRKLHEAERCGNIPYPALSSGAGKRECRKHRTRLFLEVKVILAELGIFDLIRKLERVSFKKRLHLLDEYLTYWKMEGN